VLCGILFVLYTGVRWEWLPGELGFGCGMTYWRRLRDWNNAGVWQRLHELLLAELRAADKLDLSRVPTRILRNTVTHRQATRPLDNRSSIGIQPSMALRARVGSLP
jgi:transposase